MSDDGIREDRTIWPVMTAMAGCLEAEFEKSGLGGIDKMLLWPGADITDLRGDGGCVQAWVRLNQEYPSTNFPNQDTTHPGTQWPLAIEIVVGVAHCVSIGDDPREGPTPEEVFNDTRLQLAYMSAMRRAICTCLNAEKKVYILEDYTPSGPLGGTVMGEWAVLVRWDKDS